MWSVEAAPDALHTKVRQSEGMFENLERDLAQRLKQALMAPYGWRARRAEMQRMNLGRTGRNPHADQVAPGQFVIPLNAVARGAQIPRLNRLWVKARHHARPMFKLLLGEWAARARRAVKSKSRPRADTGSRDAQIHGARRQAYRTGDRHPKT